MTKPYAVGIDLGGTNIKGGLVGRDAAVRVRHSIQTEAEGGAAHVIERIAGLVEHLLRQGEVEKTETVGVCVGSPGPLNSKTGVIFEAPNLYWRDVPLRDLLEERLSMPVFVENDANVAALGEAWAGAARDAECVILLTLGTGVGGGIVINGEIWRGVDNVGGELGHVCIDFDGPPCNCGSRGCIEAYAAGPAVVRRMREAIQSGRDSSLKARFDAGQPVDAEQIHQAALAGDAVARKIIEETGRLLGVAVASYVNIFNPNHVILHGGLVNAGEMLLEPLIDEMKRRCFGVAQEQLTVLPSALKGDAGIVGAARGAFMRTKDSA